MAALRPEKNHEMFLRVAALVRRQLPAARFLVVGDGPQRTRAGSARRRALGIAEAVRFLGTRSDVPEVLSLLDVLVLTSHMEANPVCDPGGDGREKPVVATRVGSVAETVLDGRTGYLVAPGDAQRNGRPGARTARPTAPRAAAMGRAGREQVIAHWSVDRMVRATRTCWRASTRRNASGQCG